MTIFKTEIGFSIELTEWKLERRGEYKNLPLYESLGGKVIAISLVNEPAIGEKTVGNEVDKTIAGPVMIPNQKIFRNIGLNGPENCYWFFSTETIRKLQQNFKGKIKVGH
jgi:hypothetical protein